MQALREYGERLTSRHLYNLRVHIESTSSPGTTWDVRLQRANFQKHHTFKVSQPRKAPGSDAGS